MILSTHNHFFILLRYQIIKDIPISFYGLSSITSFFLQTTDECPAACRLVVNAKMKMTRSKLTHLSRTNVFFRGNMISKKSQHFVFFIHFVLLFHPQKWSSLCDLCLMILQIWWWTEPKMLNLCGACTFCLALFSFP